MPLPPVVMVIQEVLLVADRLQVVPLMARPRFAVRAPALNDWLVGEEGYGTGLARLQNGQSCRPAIVIVPVREDVPVLADTE